MHFMNRSEQGCMFAQRARVSLSQRCLLQGISHLLLAQAAADAFEHSRRRVGHCMQAAQGEAPTESGAARQQHRGDARLGLELHASRIGGTLRRTRTRAVGAPSSASAPPRRLRRRLQRRWRRRRHPPYACAASCWPPPLPRRSVATPGEELETRQMFV